MWKRIVCLSGLLAPLCLASGCCSMWERWCAPKNNCCAPPPPNNCCAPASYAPPVSATAYPCQ